MNYERKRSTSILIPIYQSIIRARNISYFERPFDQIAYNVFLSVFKILITEMVLYFFQNMCYVFKTVSIFSVRVGVITL